MNKKIAKNKFIEPHFIKKSGSGFTLVEAVVYLAIVGILLTAVVSFNLILGNTAAKLGASVDTSRNRRTALNDIDYLVKNSNGFLKDTSGDCSTFDTSPQILALYFDDDTYLPGTCVENGGGVRITLGDRRVAMYCYPNMNGNGHYNNCDTSIFATGSAYYLSSDDVEVLDSSLSFATSTATSTGNPYINITTTLSVSSQNSRQAVLSATSTASSTVVAYGEKPSSLVSFWSFEEGSGTTPTDYEDGNNATCYPGSSEPAYVTGIVAGSSYALDFESTSGHYCKPTSPTNPDNLNFSDQFTLSAWIKPESLPTEADIIDKETSGTNRGYKFWINSSGDVYCRVLDSTTSQDTNTSATVAADGSIYHVSCVYDYPNNRFQVYVFKKGVNGLATSTSPGTVATLVNDADDFYISQTSTEFDGIIDDLRVYNRALSQAEIWALQSQGDY